MEQAIIALLGVSITLTLYLDRGRRADLAQLRTEMRADLAQLREETQAGFAQLHGRIDKLTKVVMDLCRRVGRLEGRAETAESPTQASP
ncbi:hypothetical protein [Candidatus Poriferisocius sp.]|uniref:hypothetical protein n=1 Tax=Candidatus Poriferisocius sp. TaxID=3101276 RepID=UPI003B01B4C3